jgi:hypothetical protein
MQGAKRSESLGVDAQARAALESMPDESAVPPFSLTRPRYNMETFRGRLRHVLLMIHALFLLAFACALRSRILLQLRAIH